MEIADSARKHGVTDDDMRHAVRNALRSIDQGDGFVLFIARTKRPDPRRWLYSTTTPAEEPVIIHAMPASRESGPASFSPIRHISHLKW